ncbi:MAG: S8 family serine peptidase [Bacteroidetes bacterium]|nr:S8 family serine peptidase [Bacteroidota bacterium]
MKKLISIAVLFVFFGFAFGQTGKDWRQKVDASLLEKTAGGQSVPFLILLAQQADPAAARQLKTKDEKAAYVFNMLRQTAIATQARLAASLTQKNAPHESLFIVNAIKTEGNLDLINSLAQRVDVAKIMDNPTMRFAEPVERLEGAVEERALIEWGIEKINADDVWALGYRGQGVVVGGEDTGYDWQHPALKNQYRGYYAPTDTTDHDYNWHDAIHQISPLNGDSLNPCGLDSPVPCDDYGHGTHTMGTMVGLDGDNEIGVAPEAQWCACRNMERGWGSPFTYLECFQWFVAPTDLNDENPDPSKSPHVINNSWYCATEEGCNPSNFQVMNLAVNNLRLAGTVVVVSAGNSGSGCGSIANPPAMFESSFVVGATAINDTIAGFSSRGPVTVDGSNRLKPNVAAPGVNVRSSVPGGGYANYSGTSMAGPHVVGLVALVISANPDLAGQVDLIEDIIEQTAVPKTTDQNCGTIPGTDVPNHTYGFGRVDALAAVEAAIALIPPPPSSTQEQVALPVRVFPNPVDNQLVIEVKNVVGEVQVEFFDINGRLLLQRRWNGGNQASSTFDFKGKPSGIYFYRMLNGGNVQQGKVVKK